MSKKKEVVFPRNVYKKGGPLMLCSAGRKYPYATVLVENEDELKEATSEGYADDFGIVMSEEKEKKGFLGSDKKASDDDDF